MSNKKLRALNAFSKGKDFGEISRDLRIQRVTAEVYTIDTFAAGKDIDMDHLSELLQITEESFSQIQQLLSLKDRLNEVKEALPEVSYNQIRFVLACMIRDVEM